MTLPTAAEASADASDQDPSGRETGWPRPPDVEAASEVEPAGIRQPGANRRTTAQPQDRPGLGDEAPALSRRLRVGLGDEAPGLGDEAPASSSFCCRLGIGSGDEKRAQDLRQKWLTEVVMVVLL